VIKNGLLHRHYAQEICFSPLPSTYVRLHRRIIVGEKVQTCFVASNGLIRENTVTSVDARQIALTAIITRGVIIRPPLWSSGQEFLATDSEVLVRLPALADFLRSSGYGTGLIVRIRHTYHVASSVRKSSH
jgi:hypothetical protein